MRQQFLPGTRKRSTAPPFLFRRQPHGAVEADRFAVDVRILAEEADEVRIFRRLAGPPGEGNAFGDGGAVVRRDLVEHRGPEDAWLDGEYADAVVHHVAGDRQRQSEDAA